jgi:stearoyl-CoA desaturase (delta-9 desaturase)
MSPRDHWLGAVLTNGEGYHNFHHRFPGDYRNGIRWYHWDPSKWLIFLFAKLGLAWDLKRTPAERLAAGAAS